jgi:hypothetical protein
MHIGYGYGLFFDILLDPVVQDAGLAFGVRTPGRDYTDRQEYNDK